MEPATTQPIALQTADVERERLTSLINSMADGVIAIDERAVVVITNGAALNILDVNSTLSGKPIRDVLNLIDKNNQVVDIMQVIVDCKTQMTNRDWRLIY